MRNKFNLNTLSLHNNLQQSIPILTTIFTLPFFLQLKCLLLLPCKVIKKVYWQMGSLSQRECYVHSSRDESD